MYRENTAGRLYGVTFIEHNTGVVLNGSRLGKEYAANAIVDRLENPSQYEHLTNTAQPQSSTHFAPKQQPLPPVQQSIHRTEQPMSSKPAQQPIHRTEQHLEGSGIANSIGSLFDIPILPNGDDPEEDMFRRQMQKKKKRGRRI